MTVGTLYLVPTPLDYGCRESVSITDVLPMATLHVASSLQHWISENAKSTRTFLKRVNEITPLSTPLQSQQIVELPRQIHKKGDHTPQSPTFDARALLLTPALEGHDVGLLSEAGMPAIADPGSSIVRTAHALQVPVQPLVGPVSILLTLAASGLNGQNFAFVGYLPQDSVDRSTRIRELEALASKTNQTQLFIETPYRNAALLNALLSQLCPQTHLAMCAGATLTQAKYVSMTVSQWRNQQAKALTDVTLALPAVFAIGP